MAEKTPGKLQSIKKSPSLLQLTAWADWYNCHFWLIHGVKACKLTIDVKQREQKSQHSRSQENKGCKTKKRFTGSYNEVNPRFYSIVFKTDQKTILSPLLNTSLEWLFVYFPGRTGLWIFFFFLRRVENRNTRRKKPLGASMVRTPGFELRPHQKKASALITAPLSQ